MGMSASQARLLTLTARLSDLELEAQQISNAKIRLSQKTEQAATEYNAALDQVQLQVLSGVNTTTQELTYVDATAYNLTNYQAVSSTDKQRFLEDSTGRILVSEGVADAYDACGGDFTTFLHSLGYAETTDEDGTTVTVGSHHKTLSYDSGAITYYQNVFEQIQNNGYNCPGDEEMNSTDWLYSQLSSGNLTLVEWDDEAGDDGAGGWEAVSWSSGDSTLKSTTDDDQIAKAEAKYDVEMAAIQSKDKKFDLQLQQINTEHNAVQTEFESVQKVIEKNIERSFKIFQA